MFERLDGIVQFGWYTEIWHGFPNKERVTERITEFGPPRFDAIDQVNAAGRSAYQMERFGG